MSRDHYIAPERRNSSSARRAVATSTAVSTVSAEGSGEAAAGGDGMPYVFFPHSYDAISKGPKNDSLVVEEFRDSYMVCARVCAWFVLSVCVRSVYMRARVLRAWCVSR